jgi:ABC-type Co2+ transport system permease subunit
MATALISWICVRITGKPSAAQKVRRVLRNGDSQSSRALAAIRTSSIKTIMMASDAMITEFGDTIDSGRITRLPTTVAVSNV